MGRLEPEPSMPSSSRGSFRDTGASKEPVQRLPVATGSRSILVNRSTAYNLARCARFLTVLSVYASHDVDPVDNMAFLLNSWRIC